MCKKDLISTKVQQQLERSPGKRSAPGTRNIAVLQTPCERPRVRCAYPSYGQNGRGVMRRDLRLKHRADGREAIVVLLRVRRRGDVPFWVPVVVHWTVGQLSGAFTFKGTRKQGTSASILL